MRLGIISREETTQLFKVDRSISEAVFDFLVKQEDIIMRNSEEIQVSWFNQLYAYQYLIIPLKNFKYQQVFVETDKKNR